MAEWCIVSGVRNWWAKFEQEVGNALDELYCQGAGEVGGPAPMVKTGSILR